MCRNLRKWFALGLTLLLLAGCGAKTNGEAALLQQAERTETEPKLAAAELGSIVRKTQGVFSCEAYYDLDEELTCGDFAGMVLDTCYVTAGQAVEAGQPLALFRLPEDAVTRAELDNRLREAELRLEASRAAAAGAVQAAQKALDAAAPGTPAAQAAAYRLEKANLAALNLDDSAVTAAKEAISDYEAALQGKELTAPFAGTVEQLLRVSEKPVTAQTVFCRLFTAQAVFLRCPGVNEIAFRVGTEVTVSRQGQEYCSGTVISAAEAFGAIKADVIVLPEEETDTAPFFERNPGLTMQAVRLQLDQVLRLPKAAVRSEGGLDYVYLYENGSLHKRYVQLGLEGTDPGTGVVFVQILEGLEVGDRVTVG